MKYGNARVSTDDQSAALQLAGLKRAGCKTLFKDEGLSGATTKPRPVLRKMVLTTTKAIASACILCTVFSAAVRRLVFCNIYARVHTHQHRELLRRGLTWQECNLTAVADAKCLVHSSPAKSPVECPPSAYFRVVWQSPAACKLLKVHLIGAMAWKRSSVRSRPGPPNIYNNINNLHQNSIFRTSPCSWFFAAFSVS